jgi:hypothetical protein
MNIPVTNGKDFTKYMQNTSMGYLKMGQREKRKIERACLQCIYSEVPVLQAGIAQSV